MSVNRGKQFEQVIKEAFENVPHVSVDRLHDQTTGYRGSSNICDFIVYKYPYQFYIECKTVHGNTLPFSNITDTQWKGLLEKSKINGVMAGVICWWVDKDVTKFISIGTLEYEKSIKGAKSVRYDIPCAIELTGKKKRVFFDYSMEKFFKKFQIDV